MLFVVAAVGLLGADQPKTDAKKELAKLQGTWRLVSAESDGVCTPEERVRAVRVTIDGRSHSVRVGDEVVARGVAFEIDPTKSPKQVTDTIGEGPNEGKTIPGIYKLEGDTLVSCVAKPGADRPTKFSEGRQRPDAPRLPARQGPGPRRGEGRRRGAEAVRGDLALRLANRRRQRSARRCAEGYAPHQGDHFEMVDPRGTYRGIAEIDPTATPKTIDVVFTEGLEAGKTVIGIYVLDGDTYTLCSTGANRPRPKQLESKAGTTDSLTVLTRIKP
jgi:uncharacterized protein (TIGR03067 family)